MMRVELWIRAQPLHIYPQNERQTTLTPEIEGPDKHNFHDSSLIDFIVSPHLDTVKVVVSTPDDSLVQRLWLIEFGGVLRLEYETLGNGKDESYGTPHEIYDIYNDNLSAERQRWVKRLNLLGVGARDADNLYHIVLASSFMRGWGNNEHLEGINIICRSVTIMHAPKEYRGLEYSRHRIEGSADDN